MDSMEDWQEQLVLTAKNTLVKLHHEHEAFLAEEKEERFDTYAEVLSEDDWQHRDDLLEQYNRLTTQTELFSYEQWTERFEEKRKDILDNAAIIPADFREKLRAFLESRAEALKLAVYLQRRRKQLRKKNVVHKTYKSNTKRFYNHKLSV